MSNFKYYESDYEEAFLEYLIEDCGWEYECGYDIHRLQESIIIEKDFKEYINNNYPSLDDDDINRLITFINSSHSSSLYRSMKETYNILMKGKSITTSSGESVFVSFIDFNNIENNIFKSVNQYEFKEYEVRRPDIILFINGIPLSIIELKNPADETVNIKDAYDQTHIRYAQDIPSLMKYDFINVISDGANTKYGSLFSSYDFYFKWNSTDGINYENVDGLPSVKKLINGLYDKYNFLNIIHNYIFFPDNSDDDTLIIPKYYQYYGAEAMFSNILNEYRNSGNKGGTYWGATGCGKSYIMLFLSKRLTTCVELNKPTILLLTDRNDLDTQLSENFENAKNYLIDDNSIDIADRKQLKEKLDNIKSGGIYLMTIQKFSAEISLLSERKNIICISDEAHRTQTNIGANYKITEDGATKSYGFAKYLRDSFPNAIYVGFTGTPIDPTLRVFGNIICNYTMKQSLSDGSTVKIAMISGPREVQLDEHLAKACDNYYKMQEEAGTNQYQIEESKKQMANVKTILISKNRLDIVVDHFIQHYERRCYENATVDQKAMFVCYDRELAYEVYKRIKEKRPEWLVKRKNAPEFEKMEVSRDSIEIEKVKLICSDAKNDTEDFKRIIGTKNDRETYARAFKDPYSNFKIAIVVDMWITGFDVPCLDTMYIDKPIETHNLIQTISRVNRNFKGKEEGLIVDYIGLKSSLATAMKLYGSNEINPVNSIEISVKSFKDYISRLNELMSELDFSTFFDKNITPVERIEVINKGVEFVLSLKDRETKFMGYTKRAKKSFDICIGNEEITTEEIEQLHYYLCVRSVIYKMTKGDTPDSTLMNNKIKELVDRAISSTYSNSTFTFDNDDDKEYIFGDEFLEELKRIKYPNTKFQALIKLLKKAITEFGKTNILKSREFSERLKRVIDKYNNRDNITYEDIVYNDVLENLSEEVVKIYKDLGEEQESFKKLNITYDEKAFFDILKMIAIKYKFDNQFDDKKLVSMAKQIKVILGNKSKYTDWSIRQDIKDELYYDIKGFLHGNGFPPTPAQDAYDEVMKQVENFKKYN